MYWLLRILLLVVLLPTLCRAGVSCDGVDDKLTTGLTGTSFFASTASTITAWVKLTGSTTTNTASYLGHGIVADLDGFWGLYRNNTGASGDQLWAYNYDGSAHEIGVAFTNNAWTHVAMTVGSGTLTFYKDGVVVSTAASTSVDRTGQVLACTGYSGSTHYWTGQVTDVHLYNTALTASQIEVMARGRLQTFAVDTTSLTALWDLGQCADGAAGNAVAFVDRSGNGRTLTGDDGANNTGLTCRGSELLSQPWGAN